LSDQSTIPVEDEHEKLWERFRNKAHQGTPDVPPGPADEEEQTQRMVSRFRRPGDGEYIPIAQPGYFAKLEEKLKLAIEHQQQLNNLYGGYARERDKFLNEIQREPGIGKTATDVNRKQLDQVRPLLRMLGLDKRPIEKDLLSHLLRDDIDLPQIFVNMSSQPERQLLMALEAKAVFRYFLPRLRVHSPEQILELRERVADTREGFTMRLQELSADVEERAREVRSLKEWEECAKSVVDTKLVTAYHEFRRQIRARAIRKTDKVLDAAGSLFEIDATITSPKFWGGILKALGLLDSVAKADEELTNKYQAFKFMREIEAAGMRDLG
jgi:hypothetical protein